MALRENVGFVIAKLRTAAGHSQEGFAVLTGLSASSIGEIERGITNFGIDAIEKVARGLGTSPLYLMRLAMAEEQFAPSTTPLKERRTGPGYEVGPNEPTRRDYALVIERTRGAFSAYCPDLPSCGAVADSIESVEAAMRADVTAYLQWLHAAGRPIPEAAARVTRLEITI